MDAWRLLNKVRRSIYLDGRHQGCENDLYTLITMAFKSDDTELIKSVLIIKEDFEKVSPKKRLLWLTSKLRNRLYPPLPVDIAGPLVWNNELRLLNSNTDYCYETPLKANVGSTGLSQCRNLEDCSFVTSLIGMKARNISMPEIRQFDEYLYHVNLHFNGSGQRLVSVDASKIPTNITGDQLSLTSDCIIDKVIEMAYLQITSGSYSTTGSNAAIDTFLLTGYIPEVQSVSNISSIHEFIECFKTGKCLLALGTGRRQGSSLSTPLLRKHDYSVIQVDSQRNTMTLRDPLDPFLKLEANFDVLIKNYEQVYINWCTNKLFAFEKTVEFFYNFTKCNAFDTAMDKPLFLLENDSTSEQHVWLLLESHLKPKKGESIAYLQELPSKNALSPVGAPYEGACDIGLQLLKVNMDPESTKGIFCHSSTSSEFTVHLYSDTEAMKISRWNANKISKTLECNTDNLEQCYLGSQFYYKSPSFQFEIVYPEARQFHLSLQLLSENRQEMVNLQIYYLRDHSLQKPILEDSTYTLQRHDRFFLPFLSNVPYKLVCSFYDNNLKSHTYKLQIMPSDDQSILPCFRIKQIHMQFGGLPFQMEKKLYCNTQQTKISISTLMNTTFFIRVVPAMISSLVKMRLTVCDSTGTTLCGTEFYQPPPPGGMVIDNWKSTGPAKYTLIIDFVGPTVGNSPYLTVLIGSSKKITMDEGHS